MFTERHQFRTGDTQIVLGVHNHRLFQQAGVKGDLIEALKQQRIGDQRQIRMKAEGGMAPKTQPVSASTSAGLAREAFSPPK